MRFGLGGRIHAHYDTLFKVRRHCCTEGDALTIMDSMLVQGFTAFVPDNLVQLLASDDLIDFIGGYIST